MAGRGPWPRRRRGRVGAPPWRCTASRAGRVSGGADPLPHDGGRLSQIESASGVAGDLWLAVFVRSGQCPVVQLWSARSSVPESPISGSFHRASASRWGSQAVPTGSIQSRDQPNQATSRTCSGPCGQANVRITSQTGARWVPAPATLRRLRVPDRSISSQSAAAGSAQLIQVVQRLPGGPELNRQFAALITVKAYGGGEPECADGHACPRATARRSGHDDRRRGGVQRGITQPGAQVPAASRPAALAARWARRVTSAGWGLSRCQRSECG